MSTLWYISYIGLWITVIVLALIIIAIAREVEQLHREHESLLPYIQKSAFEK